MWEVVAALRTCEPRGEESVAAVAADLTLTPGAVRVALAYYGAYPEEIDAEIAANEYAAEAAFRSWETQQRLLA